MLDLRSRLAKLRTHGRPTQIAPRIALWGTFDLADYGSLLLARIFEQELQRRLPLAQIHAFSPLGYRHPISLDGGRPALPLGTPDAQRKSQLAEQHDLVAVAGDVIHTRDHLYAQPYGIAREEAGQLCPSGFFVDGLGPDLERRCPVVWHGVGVPFDFEPAEAQRVRSSLDSRRHISVRDSASRDRLLATGSRREIAVVPDPTVLVSRIFPSDVLRKRLEYLRVMGWYPEMGAPLVVQGDSSIVSRASEIAHALLAQQKGDVEVVLAELSPGRGDTAFADAITPHLGTVYRLPTQVSLEDIAAAIAHARIFVGTSPAGSSTALAFGVPSVIVAAAPAEEVAAGVRLALEGDATVDEPLRAELQNGADAAFDELAAIAERSWSDRAGADPRTPAALARALSQADERYRILLRAHEARGERLVTERLKFAEIVDRLEEAGGGLNAEAAQRIAELENAVFVAQAAEAETRYELEQLREDRERRG